MPPKAKPKKLTKKELVTLKNEARLFISFFSLHYKKNRGKKMKKNAKRRKRKMKNKEKY